MDVPLGLFGAGDMLQNNLHDFGFARRHVEGDGTIDKIRCTCDHRVLNPTTVTDVPTAGLGASPARPMVTRASAGVTLSTMVPWSFSRAASVAVNCAGAAGVEAPLELLRPVGFLAQLDGVIAGRHFMALKLPSSRTVPMEFWIEHDVGSGNAAGDRERCDLGHGPEGELQLGLLAFADIDLLFGRVQKSVFGDADGVALYVQAGDAQFTLLGLAALLFAVEPDADAILLGDHHEGADVAVRDNFRKAVSAGASPMEMVTARRSLPSPNASS